jgi:hypothetical protein
MCFAPQLRYLMPQVGLATLLVGVMLAYVSLPPHRASRSSVFFSAYFISFGLFGLFVQLLGDVPPGMPPARPLFFYALTALALVLTGLAIMSRHRGREFVLAVLCTLLVVEIGVVGLQFTYISYGVGLAPSDDAARVLWIEGGYGNPNNVALVLAMLLMVLVISGYVRMLSLFGAALVVATLMAVFVTLSRTALVFLVLFLAGAVLAPKLQHLSITTLARAVRRVLLAMVVLGAALLVLLQRSDVITNLEDLAVVERSLTRVATLSELDQDAGVEFRVLVTLRLIEALDSLGFGSLSDRNYGEFFQAGDDPLATVNPHSYVAEMSFLFGYPGLFMSLAFLVVVIWRILSMRGSRRVLFVLFVISALFFQMVPSSLFTLDIYFLLIAVAGTRGLQNAHRPALRRLSAPSLAVSQVRLP